MAGLKELIVKIGADTRGLEKGIDTAAGKLSSFGSKATAVGSSLATSLTLPIVGAGAGILAMAGDFQAGMNKVSAISGATGGDLEALANQAKEMGSTTKFSASQAAEGMSFLAMAGFDATQTMAAMPGLLSLAAASGMDLGSAADIASNILSGFGLNAAEAGRTADVLAKAAASSNTNVSQLGQAMKFVAPVAKSVGLSIEEAAGFVGKLGDAGIQAEMAGTSLRGMIAGLVAPSGEAAKVLAQLGVSTADSTGKMLPLRDILEQLKASGASTAQMFALFGRENASAALVLQDSLPAYDDLVAKLQNSGGAAQQMATTMQGGLNGAFTSLSSAVEGLAIAIAESGLLDWATGLVVAFTDIIRELGNTSPEMLKLGTIAAGAVAAAGPLLILIGSMSSGLAALAPVLTAAAGGIAALGGGPITLSIAALIGLSGAIVALQGDSSELVTEWKIAWESIKSVAKTAADRVKTDIKSAWEAIVTFSGPIFDQIVRIADTAIGIVRELLALPGVKESVTLVWDAIKAIVQGAWEAITGIISGALTVIEGVLTTGLALLRGDWQSAGDGLVLIAEGMWTAIKGVFSGGVTAIRDTVIGMKNAVLGVFSDMGNELVGNSIVPDDIVDPTIAEFGRMKTGATEETTTLKTNITGLFGDMGTAAKNLKIGESIFSGDFSAETWKNKLKSMGDAFKDKLAQPAIDAIDHLIEMGLNKLLGVLDDVIFKTGSVGGSIGSIGGGIPGLGGGGGGAAAGVGSSMFGMVTGAITAGASVFDAILGHFGRKRAESTANAIEENTRTHMLLFADYRQSVGFFQNDELQEQTANLEYIVANGDDMKGTLWSIRDILSGGIAVSGLTGSGVADMGDAVGAGVEKGTRGEGKGAAGSLLGLLDALLGPPSFTPSRSRTGQPDTASQPSGDFSMPTRSRTGQPAQAPPTAEEIGQATRDALEARNPLAVIAAQLGNPLAQLATGSNFLPEAVEEQTAAIREQIAETKSQKDEVRIKGDETVSRLDAMNATLQQFIETVKHLLGRPVSIQVDGRELAIVVGENQEALGVTA